MKAGRKFSSFRSKLQLLSVRLIIALISLFVICKKIIFRDGQQLEKIANKYELALKYEQDTLLDVDPPFKQILFWNDVRH
jgi:hypothetical protein